MLYKIGAVISLVRNASTVYWPAWVRTARFEVVRYYKNLNVYKIKLISIEEDRNFYAIGSMHTARLTKYNSMLIDAEEDVTFYTKERVKC